MVSKILIPIFIILFVGMIAFILWPKNVLLLQKKTPVISLKSALNTAQEIACAYVDADGLTTKTYTKAGMLRSDFTGKSPADAGGVLIRDGKTYVWWTKDKQGYFAAASADNSKQKDTLVSDMEKYKDSCKPTAVSDSLFVLPTDITFRDFYRTDNPTPTP